MRALIISFLFILCSEAQNPYPQNYFKSPLGNDFPIMLSGTFAELRSNHFHSGLDIKTNGTEGALVYAAANGYVSRIKISRYGYGKALYITHPNGYTTVYTHLQKFAPKIEEIVKKYQYKNEVFELELFPNPKDLPLSSQEWIAFSGNTGGSSGPHLHFEIRDNQQRPINPMIFGMNVDDNRKPIVTDLFLYEINSKSKTGIVNKQKKLRLQKLSNGNYKSESVEAFGEIGFGVSTYDRQNKAANKNGVYCISTAYNGSKNLEIKFKRFSFAETKHINRLIDYKYYSENRIKIQKLFIEPNNPLSLFSESVDKGIINVPKNTNGVYKIIISDFENNSTEIIVPIKGVSKINKKEDHPMQLKRIQSSAYQTFETELVRVEIPANSFYEDVYLDLQVENDTLFLHKPEHALQKNLKIIFDISRFTEKDRNKLFIGKVSKYGNKLYYRKSTVKNSKIETYTKDLGTFTIGVDTVPPKVKPQNFKKEQWLSYKTHLKLHISDEISGIKNYRATINNQWILMEYDAKNNTISYDFADGISKQTKNYLKVIVTDNVGNNSKFETIFFRKNNVN